MIVFRLFSLYNLTFCSENQIFIIIILHLYWSQLSLFPSAQYLCSASTLVARQPQCDAKKSRLFVFCVFLLKHFSQNVKLFLWGFRKLVLRNVFILWSKKIQSIILPETQRSILSVKKEWLLVNRKIHLFKLCKNFSIHTHTALPQTRWHTTFVLSDSRFGQKAGET